MRKSIFLGMAMLITVLMLTGCKGSDTYRGEWKVTGSNGEQFIFIFLEKSLVTADASEQSDTIDYIQNSIQIENGIRSYGISLSNGDQYLIVFPIKGDHNKAKMIHSESGAVFTMGRSAYIDPKAFDEWL